MITQASTILKSCLLNRVFTAPDVARILNISKGAAYQLLQQRKIPCVRINRNVRVRQEDLEEFISINVV